MKRGFLFALFFCFFSIISFSQWEEQSILPNANFFNDVFVLDNNHCWVVGQGGIVMMSPNNGLTWLRLSPQTTEHLNAVWFINDQNGWLCGNNGTFKYTINGGYYWQESSLTTENDLKDIFFINENTGWVVGDNGLIYSTNDGGITWESQNSGTMHDLFSVHFINENEGWTAGYSGDILHTTNGGLSWTMQPQSVLDELFCIFFTDENHGWASGADGLLKTTDGGDTWETNQYQYGLGYRSVFFENASSGYLIITVGTSGILYYTNDGGESWESINESSFTLQGMHFCEEGLGFAVGYPDVIVYCPIFGGGCGNLSLNPEFTGFSDVFFLDSLNGWVLGGGIYEGDGILHTNDGGNNWVTQTFDDENYLLRIFFTSPDVGYGVSSSGLVFKSTNGGKLWEQLGNAPQHAYISIYFLDSLRGWLSCFNCGVIHTSDGGLTWVEDSYGQNISSVQFVDEQTGWAVGMDETNGIVKRTTDGGATWIDTQTYTLLWDVFFINQNDGWTSGNNGLYYITNDGGVNWELIDLGYEETIHYIDFVNETTGWMIIDYEMIIRSEDGGYTWEEQILPDEGKAFAIDFIDENYGWAVGDGIYFTKNGGTTDVQDQITKNKTNLLVYPNPIQNQFTVNYNIENSSSVKIDLLNITGQIVRTLSQTSLQKREHKHSFELTDIPNGLYYIRLITEDKTVTQKIIKL